MRVVCFIRGPRIAVCNIELATWASTALRISSSMYICAPWYIALMVLNWIRKYTSYIQSRILFQLKIKRQCTLQVQGELSVHLINWALSLQHELSHHPPFSKYQTPKNTPVILLSIWSWEKKTELLLGAVFQEKKIRHKNGTNTSWQTLINGTKIGKWYWSYEKETHFYLLGS